MTAPDEKMQTPEFCIRDRTTIEIDGQLFGTNVPVIALIERQTERLAAALRERNELLAQAGGLRMSVEIHQELMMRAQERAIASTLERDDWIDRHKAATIRCAKETIRASAAEQRALEAERRAAEAREDALGEARAACLSVGQDAPEAAKAKDATDYVAGYQDAATDCDEAIRALKSGGEDGK